MNGEWYERKKTFYICTIIAYIGYYGDNLQYECVMPGVGDIDLTSNDWVTISDIFKGSICGAHRIFLKYTDGKLVSGKDLEGVYYTFE